LGRHADSAVGEERHPRRRVRRTACAPGLSIAEAAVEAARIRLRPILMTSLAFILGVMPLVVASAPVRSAPFGRHDRRRRHAASTFLNLRLFRAVCRVKSWEPHVRAANVLGGFAVKVLGASSRVLELRLRVLGLRSRMLGGCASYVLGWTCTGLAATRFVTAVAQAGLTAVSLAKALSPAIGVAQTPVPSSA